MIEYPSIINSSRAPREYGIAFDKIDGSNLRFKYTPKNGFNLFGSRHELIGENHPHLGRGVTIFKEFYKNPLEGYFKTNKEYRNYREIIVFAEFYGHDSFAGFHNPDSEKFLSFFDVLVGHKNRTFVKPKDFIRDFDKNLNLPTPRVVYEGILNDEFIQSVRDNNVKIFRPDTNSIESYYLHEGVIFKGMFTNGAYRGKMWQCKIKTLEYFDRLQQKFGLNADKGWE